MKSKLHSRLLTTAPLAHLGLTIFFLRDHVGYFFAASAILIALLAMHMWRSKASFASMFPYWLIALAVIGLSASTILTIEKIELLKEPDHITSCSLSPIVACSPVISSDQASAFGFPNPVIGVFGFGAVLAAGMTVLAGAKKLHPIWWRTLFGWTVFGSGFSAWLIFQAFYRINSLCLYCMSVWLVSSALMWIVLSAAINNKSISLGKTLNKALKSPLEPVILTFVAIFGLIVVRWSDYWLSLI